MRLLLSLAAHALAALSLWLFPKFGLDGAALAVGGTCLVIGAGLLMWPGDPAYDRRGRGGP